MSTLSIAQDGNITKNELENVKPVDPLDLVRSFVPSAKLLDTVNRNGMKIEESWSLPFSSAKVFPNLFNSLQTAGMRASIGQTTLEDVFLSVGKRFGDETETLNISELPSGVYLVSINGKMQSDKLVKE